MTSPAAADPIGSGAPWTDGGPLLRAAARPRVCHSRRRRNTGPQAPVHVLISVTEKWASSLAENRHPPEIEEIVLAKSLRRCALCFHLDYDSR